MATVFGMTATATTEKAWEIGLIFGFCDGNCRLRAVYPLPSSDSIVPSAEIERGSVGRVENGRMGRPTLPLGFRARFPRSVLYYHWREKEGLLAVYGNCGNRTQKDIFDLRKNIYICENCLYFRTSVTLFLVKDLSF